MKNDVLQIRRWMATLVVLVAIAGGVVLAMGWKSWTGHSVYGASGLPVTVTGKTAPVSLGNFTNGFASVLKPALPAVVNIHTSKIVKPQGGNLSPFFNDPFFRQFFGNQFGQMNPEPEREQSLGSGVIVSADGTIITNNHVIDGATDIKVQLSDKREFRAKLIGTDPKTDIAVLKIDAQNLPTLPLGDSSQMQVGDLVFAIGDPFGIGETATMGIVSATGRGGLGIENYEDFIQTDAAINPGNSGGALIDIHGNLMGINTAILSGGSGGNEGIGFAIPINMARRIMDQILTNGKVVRGYLGVYIQDVTPDLAKQFGLSQGGGVLIGDVTSGTPAAKAGLKKGDIILKLNGEPVQSRNDLQIRISQMAPGSKVTLDVWRDGKSMPVEVTLGELPETSSKLGSGENVSSALEGVEVQDLTPDIAQQLNLPPSTQGVVVSNVDQASAAAAAGLQRQDVIQEVNHHAISNVSEFRAALKSAGDQPVLLLVNRGGITTYVVVEPNSK
ncbi:MAG TPA: DegQ family serine endoprotease [Verrucomicrobiae bacterium]|nr:DegQ family serine endoprotease [Verrucomicrobiae bacterium]